MVFAADGGDAELIVDVGVPGDFLESVGAFSEVEGNENNNDTYNSNSNNDNTNNDNNYNNNNHKHNINIFMNHIQPRNDTYQRGFFRVKKGFIFFFAMECVTKVIHFKIMIQCRLHLIQPSIETDI